MAIWIIIAIYVIIGMIVSIATDSILKKDWSEAIRTVVMFVFWPYVVIKKLNEQIEKEK